MLWKSLADGRVPHLLPFRLHFSDKLMLSLCDIFAGHIVLLLRFPKKTPNKTATACIACCVKVLINTNDIVGKRFRLL